MSEALVISNLLLWAAVLGLGVLVFALTRQIGLLHERLAPVGALALQQGPEVGDVAPELELVDMSGNALKIGGAGARTLLFFLSPTCPVCETLLPTLKRVIADESPDVRLVLASDGDPAEHQEFRRARGLDAAPYVLSTELGMRYAIAKLPSAVLIDEAGILRAKGMVNTREHLESLFQAEELGVASLQEFARLEVAS